MTTTQIIIAVCSFSIAIAIWLIIYIWTDAKKAIASAVPDILCCERRKLDREHVDSINNKLCRHEHAEDGKVLVEL
jgi:hypothetical protein